MRRLLLLYDPEAPFSTYFYSTLHPAVRWQYQLVSDMDKVSATVEWFSWSSVADVHYIQRIKPYNPLTFAVLLAASPSFG